MEQKRWASGFHDRFFHTNSRVCQGALGGIAPIWILDGLIQRPRRSHITTTCVPVVASLACFLHGALTSTVVARQVTQPLSTHCKMEIIMTGPPSALYSNSSDVFYPSAVQTLSSSYTFIDLPGIWDTIYQNLPDTSHPSSSADVPRAIHFPLLIHLLCVIPAFFLAFPLYFMKKGTRAHKITGRVFMGLMTVGVGITYNIKLLRRNDPHRGSALNRHF